MIALGVPKESAPGEARVALVPETVARFVKSGVEVVVEAGAGEAAGFLDRAYADAGARIESDPKRVFAAQVVTKVHAPGAREGGDEADWLTEGAVLVGFLRPGANAALLARLAARRVTAFALEKVPRTSRAQKMDALSSMSTVAGYRAVLLGAARLPRFFPLLMTAAGTIPPAKVFVLGAGVAGLTAIATARRLGAVVEAFDVRPAVREEVESLGATFVGPSAAAHKDPAAEELGAGTGGSGAYAAELTAEAQRREQEALARHVAQADVVITTAMVPDRAAPVLVTAAMVEAMKPGSVIVDLAAETGGNCALTRPGEDVTVHGVHVLGPLNLPSSLPNHASQMLSRNLAALIALFVKDGALALDFGDDILAGSCVARPGAGPS